nr:hypothetical protein GCM10020185_76550 [Pseudomonas brassicacearum subsp. brassicacearum]
MSRHIVVLSGSNRGDSQSLKVARYLRQRLTDLNLCDASDLIDLAACRLPLWPEKKTAMRCGLPNNRSLPKRQH